VCRRKSLRLPPTVPAGVGRIGGPAALPANAAEPERRSLNASKARVVSNHRPLPCQSDSEESTRSGAEQFA